MTRKRELGVLTAAIALIVVASGAAFSDVRRERPPRRPYIVEIGQPYAINTQALQQEVVHISELRSYISRLGYPDYAEIQEITPEWPWVPYEVRLYYLDRNLEAAFGGVVLSPAAPNFGVMKFHDAMTPEKRHEIELVLQARATPAPPRPLAATLRGEAQQPAAERMEALVSRVEAAAERAAQAADRAAVESEAAVRAADRTVATVQKMGQRARPRR